MNWRSISCALAGLLTCFACARADVHNAPAASLRVTADALQPSDAPIVLELTIQNTGATRLSYWCGGPGDYPDCDDFVATVTRRGPAETVARIRLANGQSAGGAGRAFEVAPGASVHFPAALGPLPRGSYKIEVEGAARGRERDGLIVAADWPATRTLDAIGVEVRDDPRLAAARDAGVLAKIRAHDPFARCLAVTWPRAAVREALAADLTGDDAVAADRAADGLWGDRPPDKSDLPLVARAIDQHLQPPDDGCDVGLMTRLTRFYTGTEPPELEDAIGRLAMARTDGPMGRVAIERFRWAPALDVTTHHFPDWHKDPGNPPIIDPHGVLLGTAIDLTKDPDPVERRIGFRSLVEFAKDPAAAAAIRAGLKDPDETCRRLAQAANVRIPQPAATEPSAPQP